MRSAGRRAVKGVAAAVINTAVDCRARPPVCQSSSFLPSTAAASFSAPHSVMFQRRRLHLSEPLRQSWGDNRRRPWMCIDKKCRTVNRGSAMNCEACGAAKPNLLGWKCAACGVGNLGGVKACKECKQPRDASNKFWRCADCGENNRVDEMEDNSLCGFCGYDMAPHSPLQMERAAQKREAEECIQQEQERYDDISLREADQQFKDPLEGAEVLDPSLRQSHSHTGGSRGLNIPTVEPFARSGAPLPSSHSRLRRRPKLSSAEQAVRSAAEMPQGPPGFDWMCREVRCGHINPGDEEACLKCGVHIAPAEWECLFCAAMNHLSRTCCFHCHTPIPLCWTCQSCQTTTSIYDKGCRGCATPRPPTEPRTVWEVQQETGASHRGVTLQRNQRRGEWYCPSCSVMNYGRRSECFRCGTERPAEEASMAPPHAAAASWGGSSPSSSMMVTDAAAATTPAGPTQNNWICTHCQASNFRTRQDCWKCGRESGQRGSWSKDVGTPQFEHEGFQSDASGRSAEGQMNSSWKTPTDQWTCAKCFSTNFRSRTDCHRCGAAKSTVVAPRRTQARKPVKL